MSYDKQFKQALESMPTYFSSKQFVTECKSLGIQESVLDKGFGTNFLRLNAIQSDTKRSWVKKDSVEVYVSDSNYEQECIEYLKNKGYKIMKLNWEEL